MADQISQQPPSLTATSTPASVTGNSQPVQTKMIGKYKVEVINDKCIGAASCVAIASQVFRLNEQNMPKLFLKMVMMMTLSYWRLKAAPQLLL